MKQTDKFFKRLKKTEKLNKEASLPPSVETVNDGEVISEIDGVIAFCNEHGKIVANFLESDTTVTYSAEPQLKIEKALIEPLSDTLYGKDLINFGEVIEFDGEIFQLSQPSRANYGNGYKLRNVREIILNNSLQNASNIVKAVTDTVKCDGGSKFYLLSDATNVFGENIKSAFSGYRMLWRSIAVAFMAGSFDKLSVVDFMGNCVTEVKVGAEFSKKYDRIIYTRTGRKNLGNLDGLSYYSVAKAFADFILTKNGCRSDSAVENISVSNKLYNVMCKKADERFVIDNRLISITEKEYNEFINAYLERYKNELCELSKEYLWADHLKEFLSGADFVDNGNLSEVLEELDYRVKNKIPLWKETLPSLKLDRVSLKNGRLGNYYLVKEGKKIENTFESKVIKCPEVLSLPAGEKEIKFPLSISGVTDRHYIAKVTLEKPFENETECKVELIYNFDDAKTYSFNLHDSHSKKTYNMYIEEGEPERDEMPFEMKIDADIDKSMELLRDEFIKLKGFVAKRKYPQCRRFDKEKDWEINARQTCNEIYSLWLKLPYETKRDKSNFKILHQIIDNIIQDCSIPDYYDPIDRVKVMTVRCVVELFKDGYDITEGEYRETIGWLENKNITSENNALHVISSRILSNPSISDPNLIDSVLKQSHEKARRLSLPLIANKALLEFLATHDMDGLCAIVQDLEKSLIDCTEIVKSVPLDERKIMSLMKQIRDYWEFALGILRLRGSELWNDRLARLTELKDIVYNLENQIYLHFGNNLDYRTADICFTRIQFSGIPASLYAMHPLAYTLITYLEGNPNTHVIGCGLSEA